MKINLSSLKLKKKDTDKHIHCIICSEPYHIDEEVWGKDVPDIYICNTCAHTFDPQYLLYRIDCWKHNIWKPEFDFLEWRLTWGDHDHPIPKDRFDQNREIFTS